MVRQTNLTGAESCWEDDADSEADCEKFLQNKARATFSRAEADEIDEDDDEEDENSDEDSDEDDADAEVGAAVDDTVPAVEASDSSEPPSDTAQLEGKKMAKAKAGGKTKADSIREVIAARQAAGKDLRPKDIIEALEKKGIEVNASQVSITLRSMGVPAIKRGGAVAGRASKPAAKPAAEADGEAVKSRATAKARADIADASDESAKTLVMEQLLEHAADFIREAGGFDRAQSALALCHKLIQRS
jgi:hypothetical protein